MLDVVARGERGLSSSKRVFNHARLSRAQAPASIEPGVAAQSSTSSQGDEILVTKTTGFT
jgi:hypothetical protein